MKAKKSCQGITLSDALTIFFLASKIREKTAKLNSYTPRKKFKNLVHGILGTEFPYPMHQFFLSSVKTHGGDFKVKDRQTSI